MTLLCGNRTLAEVIAQTISGKNAYEKIRTREACTTMRRFRQAMRSKDGGCELLCNRRMSQRLTNHLGNADAPQLGVDRAL